jgi:hypothetical protein
MLCSKRFVQSLAEQNLYSMMEGQMLKCNCEGSPSAANISWSSVDGAWPPLQGGRVVSTSFQAAATIIIDPSGDIAQIRSLRTTMQNNDGVHKVKKQKPGEFDILCGRGRSFQDHSGNRVLRQLVRLHSERYRRAKRSHKAPIASEIVAAFNASGNHFLKHDGKNEIWEAIDDEVAQKKVSHCFRSSPRVPSSLSITMVVISPHPGSFQQLNSSGRVQLPATAYTDLLRNGQLSTPSNDGHDTTSQQTPTCWPEHRCNILHDFDISKY